MGFDEKKKGKDLDIEEVKESDPVIQEQIKPWQKRKFKKIMSVIGFSLLAGIIFGVAGRFVFRYSDGLISKIFGLNEPYDNIGKVPSPTNNQPTGTIGNDDNPGVKIPQTSKDKEGDETSGNPSPGSSVSAEGYYQVIENLRKVSLKTERSIVNISAVTSVMSWLEENIEQKEPSLGIIVAESDTNIFILTYYDRVKSADRIEMSFDGGNAYNLSFLSVDETYNLAVLLLPKQMLKPEDINSYEVLKVGDSDDIYPGLPVIGVGSIDGNNIMVEYGYITSASYTEYITDASIDLFTTNLGFTNTSMGVITDIEGNLIGIINRKLGDSIKADINKCIMVNSMVKVAEKLCNGEGRTYFGITAEDIPVSVLRDNNLESGIYVSAVDPSSPASDAGIRKGDFIISVDDNPIDSVKAFSELIMESSIDKPLNIEIYRASKTTDQLFTVTVKLTKRDTRGGH